MRELLHMGDWIYDHRLDLWGVVILALALAWLERGGLRRRLERERYDAWWFFHLPRAHTRGLGRTGKR
jgi:hypothetical protein